MCLFASLSSGCPLFSQALREERQQSESTLKSQQGEAMRLKEEVDSLRHKAQVQLEHAMRSYHDTKDACAREEERLNKVIFDALTAVVHYKVSPDGHACACVRVCVRARVCLCVRVCVCLCVSVCAREIRARRLLTA